MKILIVLTVIYLLGCIFAYGSINASYYAIWVDFFTKFPSEKPRFKSLFNREYQTTNLYLIIFLSWIGFFIDKIIKQKGRKFLRFKSWN